MLKEFWLSVRDFWRTGKTGVALFLISVFVLKYGHKAFNFEIAKGWNGHESLQNVLDDMSSFIPVGAALVAMLIGVIDIMMLFSDWYSERAEKRRKTAIKKARAEGKAEGKVEAYREIAEWDRRRREAEARGEEFNEQPPAPPQEQPK